MKFKEFIEVATEEFIRDIQPLPPKGEIWFNKDGKIVCHICGKGFNKLSSHIVQTHGINAEEYKRQFELKKTAKLTSKIMSEFFKNKDRVDITKYSSKTQFKKSKPSVKKGTKHRLQVCLERPIEYKK